MDGAPGGKSTAKQHQLYESVAAAYGPALDRVAAAYEADLDKRRDLRQEIHLQLWRSFEVFDERCALKTWAFRVAHNTAVSYVSRERRRNASLFSLEDVAEVGAEAPPEAGIDERRALERLLQIIRKLKPLDRQIMLSYLEDMDAASIAEITGLSPANISMKIHRIKNVLARQFVQEHERV